MKKCVECGASPTSRCLPPNRNNICPCALRENSRLPQKRHHDHAECNRIKQVSPAAGIDMNTVEIPILQHPTMKTFIDVPCMPTKRDGRKLMYKPVNRVEPAGSITKRHLRLDPDQAAACCKGWCSVPTSMSSGRASRARPSPCHAAPSRAS